MKHNCFFVKIFVAFTLISLVSCGGRTYHAVEVENPIYKPNTLFESFEAMGSPETGHLITKYQIDTIFNGETDEFKRILLLRHWIKSVVPIEDFGNPYPGKGNVEQMLDCALEGQGYHCGHFMKIQNAIMAAYGYISRTLGAGPGVQDARYEHHGTNEVWVNSMNKWVLVDAKYDHHFVKDGIPLNALEVRSEYLKNEGADIQMVKGPDQVSIDVDEEMQMTKTEFAQTYTWITWDAYNDHFTAWPNHKQLLIMYEDEYYKSNTWYRGVRPHWIYGAPESLRLTEERDAIYFTPNTIASGVEINKNTANIKLISDTPGLKEYQMKRSPDDEWVKVEPEFELQFEEPEYELVLRVINNAGVTGPEHKIVIDSK